VGRQRSSSPCGTAEARHLMFDEDGCTARREGSRHDAASGLADAYGRNRRPAGVGIAAVDRVGKPRPPAADGGTTASANGTSSATPAPSSSATPPPAAGLRGFSSARSGVGTAGWIRPGALLHRTGSAIHYPGRSDGSRVRLSIIPEPDAASTLISPIAWSHACAWSYPPCQARGDAKATASCRDKPDRPSAGARRPPPRHPHLDEQPRRAPAPA